MADEVPEVEGGAAGQTTIGLILTLITPCRTGLTHPHTIVQTIHSIQQFVLEEQPREAVSAGRGGHTHTAVLGTGETGHGGIEVVASKAVGAVKVRDVVVAAHSEGRVVGQEGAQCAIGLAVVAAAAVGKVSHRTELAYATPHATEVSRARPVGKYIPLEAD